MCIAVLGYLLNNVTSDFNGFYGVEAVKKEIYIRDFDERLFVFEEILLPSPKNGGRVSLDSTRVPSKKNLIVLMSGVVWCPAMRSSLFCSKGRLGSLGLCFESVWVVPSIREIFHQKSVNLFC